MPLSHSGWLFISLVLTSLSVVVIYRLYFHPLAKLPGPFLARVSSVPAYYHTVKKDRHVWLWCLQENYGMFELTELVLRKSQLMVLRSHYTDYP